MTAASWPPGATSPAPSTSLRQERAERALWDRRCRGPDRPDTDARGARHPGQRAPADGGGAAGDHPRPLDVALRIYHGAAYETFDMARARPPRGSHAPGEFWYYNNWDFNALGTIYTRLTGEDIFEAVQRR